MEVGWDGRPYRVAKREAGMTNIEERQRDGRPCRGMADHAEGCQTIELISIEELSTSVH